MNGTHNEHQVILDYKSYLPEFFRQFIEDEFYAKIGAEAKLEKLMEDPEFLKDPIKHIGLYSDHGVVHVRDVAHQILHVIKRVNGILIPHRSHSDLEFMRAYGLLLAYLHDIGMLNFSEFGRFMHPEFAAQFVFSKAFNEQMDQLWSSNAGNIPWQLLRVYKNRFSEGRIRVIFREMLALSVAHSKSKMPIGKINDLPALQHRMQWILSTSLEYLYIQQKIERFERKFQEASSEKAAEKMRKKRKKFEDLKVKYDGPRHSNPLTSFYENFESQAFSWLSAKNERQQRLVINVLDTLRCLRTADALRQRGTELRTSAGYEIFVDQNSANAIFALRSQENGALFMLEGKKPINSGEANLASSDLDANGDLRVSFHKGRFSSKKVTRRAAQNAAVAINDIQGDTIESFLRVPELDEGVFEPPQKAFKDIKILIEGVDENPEFSQLVKEELDALNPKIQDRLRTTASLQGAELEEVNRYLSGIDFYQAFEAKTESKMLARLKHSGINLSEIDKDKAFSDVKVIQVNPGETLIKSNTESGFVYIPMSDGLEVTPLGGYASKPAVAWVPQGNTGVIRGAMRNANVIAEKSLKLIVIPKEIYLKYWYAPYDAKTLAIVWQNKENT